MTRGNKEQMQRFLKKRDVDWGSLTTEQSARGRGYTKKGGRRGGKDSPLYRKRMRTLHGTRRRRGGGKAATIHGADAEPSDDILEPLTEIRNNQQGICYKPHKAKPRTWGTARTLGSNGGTPKACQTPRSVQTQKQTIINFTVPIQMEALSASALKKARARDTRYSAF